MLSKLRVLLWVIDNHRRWVNEYPNGLQIANEHPNGWSRATTYRWLKKAKKMGLLHEADWGNYHDWAVTPHGHEFMGGWHELPF